VTNRENKKCTKCGELKSLDDFYSQKKKRADGNEYIYYRPDCKECTKNNSIEWQNNNSERYMEKHRKTNQAYRRRNIEFVRNIERYRRENGLVDQWREQNKDKLKTYNSQHSKHNITENEWSSCKKYFNNRCAYCGISIDSHYIKFNGEIRNGDFHREHVDYNGSDDLSNCVPSCKVCNSRKNTYSLEEWFEINDRGFTKERLDKVRRWLDDDYKLYIEKEITI